MNTDQKIGTIIPGIGAVLLVFLLLWWGSISSGPLRGNLARTESVQAVVTKAEASGYGFVIGYRFGRYDWQTNTRLESVFEQAKKTGKVEVWFDPDNPFNSGLEKPSVLGWTVVIAPYLFALFVVVLYLAYLDDLLGWGIIKKRLK